MRRTSMVMLGMLALGLALGLVVGPLVGGSASAQTQPSTTPTTTTTTTDDQGQWPGASLRNLFLDKLAAALNVTRSTLDSAITSAGGTTVSDAVTQGLITQAQGDAITARIQAGDLGALWGGHGPRGGARVAGLREAIVDAAAQALNLTTDELTTQLRNGQTLAEIAQAQGVTEQAVIDAALAAAKTQLDSAVTDSSITRAQADAVYAQLQAQGADILMMRGPGGRHGGHGRGNWMGQP